MQKSIDLVRGYIKGFMKYFVVSRFEEIPFIIFISFFLTFIFVRLYVYVSINDVLNLTFLIDQIIVNGIHIHHLNFGIILLVLVGFWALYDVNREFHRWLALIYGIGLALTFDEFALWLKLENDYYAQISYNAIVIICGFLLSIIYFPSFWRTMGKTIKGTLRLTRKIVGF